MFSFQCRYCKVNFDQWGKLVTHRRNEHWKELEALKCALSLRKTNGIGKKAIDKKLLNGHKLFTLNKMKPNKWSFFGSLSSNVKTPTKEVDAKDLENKEISLRIPTKDGPSGSQSSSSLVERQSICSSALSFPTPPSNNSTVYPYPYQNGGMARFRDATTYSFLTPPETPSPSTSGQLELNWEVPLSNKAVRYHQIDDEAEIEICAIPSTSDGSRISLKRHSTPFPISNGNHLEHLTNFTENMAQRCSNSNHVVVDKLEHELRIGTKREVNDTSSNGRVLLSTSSRVSKPEPEPASSNHSSGITTPQPTKEKPVKRRLQSQLQNQQTSRKSPRINLVKSSPSRGTITGSTAEVPKQFQLRSQRSFTNTSSKTDQRAYRKDSRRSTK